MTRRQEPWPEPPERPRSPVLPSFEKSSKPRGPAILQGAVVTMTQDGILLTPKTTNHTQEPEHDMETDLDSQPPLSLAKMGKTLVHRRQEIERGLFKTAVVSYGMMFLLAVGVLASIAKWIFWSGSALTPLFWFGPILLVWIGFRLEVRRQTKSLNETRNKELLVEDAKTTAALAEAGVFTHN